MATGAAIEPAPSIISDGFVPYRLSAHQYESMIAKGILPEDVKVELLQGVLVTKMTQNPPHAIATYLLVEALRHMVPAGWLVFQETPVAAGHYDRPEPDIT